MLRPWLVGMGWVGACEGIGPGGTQPSTSSIPTDPTSDQGWCAVVATFDRDCVVCHSTAAALGDLDLETDPFAAVVGVASTAYGAILVDPGNPDGSLLLRKVEGTVGADEGGIMPPSGLLDATAIGDVRQWIADGASASCDDLPTVTVPTRYHPLGWTAADAHGIAAKLLTPGAAGPPDDCQSCHGEDLAGGTSGVSCADCHASAGFPDWTRDCTFCHGDRAKSGADAPAPPQDIDDEDDPSLISFPAHPQHLSSGAHPDWNCTQCHVLPLDVFSDGHLFTADTTAGQAELAFGAGLFADGAYNFVTASCSGGYCHSDGQASWSPRTVNVDASLSCGGCHGDLRSVTSLSGRHKDHEEGTECADCHPTALGNDAIDEPDLHVNAQVDVALPAVMTFDDSGNDTCTGSCHGHNHEGTESHWL